MNLLAPIIFIIASVGIFFGYVDPNYKGKASFVESDYTTYGVKQLQTERDLYSNTATNSNEVTAKRDSLTKKQISILSTDQEKLSKLLPDNIDNVKLILEVSDIAEKRSLTIRNISLGGDTKKTEEIGPDNSAFGTVSLRFNVISTYPNFLEFLNDLESNLRLVDVKDISFNSTDNGFYEFSFSLNTYWLK
jgi:hypothetical protein